MTDTIYLDANATTPVYPAALAAAVNAMEQEFGNPSSTHVHGVRARAVVDRARAYAAAVIGAGDGRVMFNSGATEGIQTAVLSALCDIRARRLRGEATGNVLLYGATEHKAVPQSLAHWNALLSLNLELRALPVDANGRHDLRTLREWLPQTAMLCTMAANNETGVVSDLDAIGHLLHRADAAAQPRVLWLVDCVQALGKLALDLGNSRVDYAPFSGHKLYAPKGVGMLYVRHGAPFTPLMAGGGQESGMRGGTENVAGIAALGEVLKACLQGGVFADSRTLVRYRDRLEVSLRKAFPGVQFNAPLESCLPTTLNFSVEGINSKALMDVFDAASLRVSAGSACSAAKAAPSAVLDAMGLPAWQTASAVRMSFGPLVTEAMIDAACDAIARCAAALQAAQTPVIASPAWEQAGDGHITALHWSEMESFLRSHPDSLLVDVREAVEHEVSGGLTCAGRRAVNAPLPYLADAATPWLGSPTAPVVFVCRSGNRSLKAAQWLQAQGHPVVRHIHGGLALRPV